jgi:hypothetical protein
MDLEIQADAEQDYLEALRDAALQEAFEGEYAFDPTDEELDAMEADRFPDYNYQEGDENS